QILYRVEEILQPGVETGIRVGKQVVDPRRERVQHTESRLARSRRTQLLAQHLVIDALDRGDLRAAADIAIAHVLPVAGCELRNLAAVAGRIRVRDVVPGHFDGTLESEHSRKTGA